MRKSVNNFIIVLILSFVCIGVHAQDKPVRNIMPVRLSPAASKVASNNADSIAISKDNQQKALDLMDKGKFGLALSSLSEAYAYCPISEADLHCEIKSNLAQLYLQLNSYSRAYRLLNSVDSTIYLGAKPQLIALHYYNLGLYEIKSSKANKSHMYDALGFFKELHDKAYIAKAYNYIVKDSLTIENGLNYINEAISINKELDKPYLLISNYNTLALCLNEKGKHSQAISALDSALVFYDKKNPTDNIIENFEVRAKVYASMGKYRQAYELLTECGPIKSKIAVIDNIDNINTYLTEKELIKKGLFFEFQKRELNARLLNRTLWVVICILIIIVIATTLALVTAKHKRRMVELERDKKAVELENEHTKNELTSISAYLHSRNEIIENIQSGLTNILKTKGRNEGNAEVEKLNLYLKSIKSSDKNNFEIDQTIAKMSNNFIEKLCAQHPHLTKNDRNIASLLRANMSSKQISVLLNISPTSVNMARYRMRRNLNIDTETKLVEYLQSL